MLELDYLNNLRLKISLVRIKQLHLLETTVDLKLRQECAETVSFRR